MTTKNKFRHHNYINLPDEVKSNYEGQFPSNFTDKVTELWEQSSERTGYQGKLFLIKLTKIL